MSPRQRTTHGLVSLALLAGILVGCATPAPEPTDTAGADPTSAPAPTDTSAPAPAPSATASEPACDTIISASLTEELTSLGWTAKDGPFTIGAAELDGGIQCTWANYGGPASDNVLVFGWAPIAASEATRVQSELLAQGWVREDGPEGIYLTTDPDYVVAPDENGYGMTYLFGDGWVTVASTKQGLVLIAWPPA